MPASGKRRRTAHYWSDEPGLRDEDIKSAMKKDRFQQIYAQQACRRAVFAGPTCRGARHAGSELLPALCMVDGRSAACEL
eukprot:7345246-Prymnesium_polylepis.2